MPYMNLFSSKYNEEAVHVLSFWFDIISLFLKNHQARNSLMSNLSKHLFSYFPLFILAFSLCLQVQAQNKPAKVKTPKSSKERIPKEPREPRDKTEHTIVTGKVTNEEGEALPFVNVIFTGTIKGGVTDFDGNYEIKIRKSEDAKNPIESISVSFVGYEPKIIPIQPEETQVINVTLSTGAVNLEEVIVQAPKKKRYKDTTAIMIYRRVVNNKDKNRPANFDYYSYDDYAKIQVDLFNISEKFKENKFVKPFSFALENTGTTADGKEYLPALLKETSKEIYYRKDPNDKKEIITGDRFSGIKNPSIGKFIDFQFDEVDIYDNLVLVSGKSFISPFANGALLNYRYYVTDSTFLDNQWCYKLEFVGRSKQSLTFIGFAWIHDTTYAVKSVEMSVLSRSNLNFINDFGVSQYYTFEKDKYWFKQKETRYTSMNISKSKDKGSVRITKTSSRRNVRLNEPIEDAIFEGEEVEIVGAAREQEEGFWEGVRHEPLSKQESTIYSTVDSIKKTPTYKKYYWWIYALTSAHFKAGPVEFGQWYKFLSWNDVEGIRMRFGGRTNYQFSDKFHFNGYGAYGTTDNKIKYNIEFKHELSRKNELWHQWGASYFSDYTRLGQTHRILTHDNFALSVFSGGKIEKLMLLKEANLFYEKEWVRGLNNKVSLAHKRFFAVPGVFDFTKLQESTQGGELIDSVAVEHFTTTEISLETRYSKQEFWYENLFMRRPILSNPNPVFIFNYTAGIKGLLKSEYNYHKLDLKILQRMYTRFGYTDYKLMGGIVLGNVPYPLLRVHAGNESFINNITAYSLMDEFEYVSDRYAAFWIDHHFEGMIMNRVPLFNKLKLRSLFTMKALVGEISEKNKVNIENENSLILPNGLTSLSDDGKLYMEIGFGIENIVKTLRVDFLWRLTQASKPDIQHWGIKLYIQPKF